MARRIQEKAAGVGFDWDNLDNVFDKIYEEIDELKEAIKSKQKIKIQDELGDVLFSVVNLSRHVECDPELSLGHSTNKFIERFQKFEEYIQKNNLDFGEQNLTKLDIIWNIVKSKEQSNQE